MTKEFEKLLLAALPGMRSYAFGLTRNRADGDDLLHDVVVKLIASADRFQPGSNFIAWAFTAIRNRFRDGLREVGCRGVHRSCDDIREATPANQEDTVALAELLDCIARLSLEHRDIINLVVGRDISYATAAAIVGCSVGTVRSRLARARMELKAMLQG